MEKFERKYFASWTDLDPNWHVANHAYIKYAADTRVSFFSELKLDRDKFNNLNIGPVLFYENMHYYKEIMMGIEFSIDVEIDGYSDDGRFFSLFQNFYDMSGIHLAHLCLLYTSPSPRDKRQSRMPSSA